MVWQGREPAGMPGQLVRPWGRVLARGVRALLAGALTHS
jgi:hypothetical protein